MNQSKSTLNDHEIRNVNQAVDFLVPYVHSIVKLSSEVDIPIERFKNNIENLYLTIDSEDSGRIEASADHNNFKFSLLYTGTRSFVLKINGYLDFDGFSYMETNKGMNIHDDLNSGNEHVSSQIMTQFLKYYKSPYLITDIYKNFIREGESFI
mgnify:CR=1 FL=1|tara:strand:- start:164 stop:622 length:459 start_codon:yes stop_codon:yes gene_type:complete